jgi:integral membrane protein
LKDKLQSLINVGHIEGWSYLILIGIAMPLKYIFNIPQAVLVVGWVHGFLFVAYCLLVLICWIKYKWSFGFAFTTGIVSLIPFGTFWWNKKLNTQRKN